MAGPVGVDDLGAAAQPGGCSGVGEDRGDADAAGDQQGVPLVSTGANIERGPSISTRSPTATWSCSQSEPPPSPRRITEMP